MRLYKFVTEQWWVDISEIEAMFNAGNGSLEIHMKSGKQHFLKDRQDVAKFLQYIRQKHTVIPGGSND